MKVQTIYFTFVGGLTRQFEASPQKVSEVMDDIETYKNSANIVFRAGKDSYTGETVFVNMSNVTLVQVGKIVGNDTLAAAVHRASMEVINSKAY